MVKTKPNIGKLREQFRYMRELRKLPRGELIEIHQATFADTKWQAVLPPDVHRRRLEKRLWSMFCVQNYHYPDRHPTTLEFRKRAKRILLRPLDEDLPVEEKALQDLTNTRAFSKDAISRMSMAEVDRYLAVIGLFADVDDKTRRKILWEWWHSPTKGVHDRKDLKRPTRAPRLSNKWILRDVILEHPGMTFDEFKHTFGNDMPTVTRTSWHVTRTRLRKAGYDIPNQPRGRSGAAIIKGTRAR